MNYIIMILSVMAGTMSATATPEMFAVDDYSKYETDWHDCELCQCELLADPEAVYDIDLIHQCHDAQRMQDDAWIKLCPDKAEEIRREAKERDECIKAELIEKYNERLQRAEEECIAPEL